MLTTAGAVLARVLVSLLGRTWRYSVAGGDHPSGLRSAGQPFVFALWHSHLIPLIWLHRGDRTALLVSGHLDGGYLAQAAETWGYGVIRGSSTRGGATAFRQMLRVLHSGGEIAITPDGPRGPAEIVKRGAVSAAQHAGVAIVPVAAAASSCWQLRSWDRFMIPKPFARIRVVYGGPLELSRSASRHTAAKLLQDRLEAVTSSVRC